VKPLTFEQLSKAFAANPELLATAENYWLYTNRHLKLTRELQAQAVALANDLEKEDGNVFHSAGGGGGGV
jgi:hypothetical protein